MSEVRPSPDLPENFAQLYKPSAGKFRTPLDSRGIADIDQVFELAIRTYEGELPDFRLSERNRHHLYWTEEWWEDYASNQQNTEDEQTVREFRNGTPQVAYVPLSLHHWIEVSQIPPPAPSLEVMRRRNAAWASAALLLKTVRDLDKARIVYDSKRGKPRTLLGFIDGVTPRSKRKDEQYIEVIDDEYWLSEYNEHLKGWQMLVGVQSSIPAEHRLLRRARLTDVRALTRRVHSKRRAIIPKIPEFLQAA